VQAVRIRPFVFGEVIGSEDPINPRKVDSEILVYGLRLRRVMPVVVSGLNQVRLQPLDRRAEVAMGPGGVEVLRKQIGDEHVVGKHEHHGDQNEPRTATSSTMWEREPAIQSSDSENDGSRGSAT